MNRGVVERSPVQQQMTTAAGNSNRWSMNNIISRPSSAQIITSFSAPPPPPPTDHVLLPHYTALPPPSSNTFWVDDNQLQLPAAESISWSQLLLGGLVEENDSNRKSSELANIVVQTKKGVENWEDVFLQQQQPSNGYLISDARQLGGGYSTTKSFFMYGYGYGYGYGHDNNEELLQTTTTTPPVKSSNWIPPVSPPASCVTTLNSSSNNSSSMVDLSGKMSDGRRPRPRPPPPLDHSSECNSTGATAGASKKARVQPSSTQSTFKVRKEKLGDRITALHQLVSPFGKTDTASVLLEAIGYIRFLQSQVEALSVPYMGKTSGLRQQQQQQQQQLNDHCEIPKKDLKSRGLCLVPISSTLQVGNDVINGADYWAPALGGGAGSGFR